MFINIIWHIEPLLGNDSCYTKLQHSLLSSGSANKHVYTVEIVNSNTEKLLGCSVSGVELVSKLVDE
jgi:hypothetical protein